MPRWRNGRRGGLKIRYLPEVCGFESLPRHHFLNKGRSQTGRGYQLVVYRHDWTHFAGQMLDKFPATRSKRPQSTAFEGTIAPGFSGRDSCSVGPGLIWPNAASHWRRVNSENEATGARLTQRNKGPGGKAVADLQRPDRRVNRRQHRRSKPRSRSQHLTTATIDDQKVQPCSGRRPKETVHCIIPQTWPTPRRAALERQQLPQSRETHSAGT